MQIISNIALLSINETMIIQLVSFLIFVFLINRIMFQPLSSEMRKRDAYIDNIGQDIISAQQSLADITVQLKEGESKAREEASAIKTEFEHKGTLEASEIIKVAMDDVTAINTTAEAEVKAEIIEARKFFKKESEALALGIMEKVLDRRLG